MEHRKYITFTIPAYNSAAYLQKCVDSLLIAGDDCEIIIINDGSKDATLAIANQYLEKFPGIVKVIDKPNGGHGSGINVGLENAIGMYFKVVDSDDWLEENALKTMVTTIKRHIQDDIEVDLYITNFTYAHQFQGHAIRDYSKQFPQGRVFDWNQSKKFHFSSSLLMHALIYKTDLLRKSGLVLPHHTYYVDNIFAYNPLPYMARLYYLPISLYQYFIGRIDQSVTLKNISANYRQQTRVMEQILAAYSYDQLRLFPRGLRNYMFHNISVMMMITQMFIVSADDVERRKVLHELWSHLRQQDIKLYRYLRYRSYSVSVNFLPWKLRGFLMVKGYLFLKKKYKLG